MASLPFVRGRLGGALAGGAAGSYLAAAQIAKVAVAHAPASAEVAIARLQADPVLRRQG